MLAFEYEKRFAAVFISDLHLHPAEQLIIARFNHFIEWASLNTQSVYILGDFFHVWPGDDGLESWSALIATRLNWLSQQNVAIYFMHGNRDFLLGDYFAHLANIVILPDPSVIQLGPKRILLTHGDRYCMQDKSHQWFRRLTRNNWFISLFLNLPFKWRSKIVATVRQHSESNRKNVLQLDIVTPFLIEEMQQFEVSALIHGHTHKPGLIEHLAKEERLQQYVLSDWDDKPQVLCYDNSKGFNFKQMCE